MKKLLIGLAALAVIVIAIVLVLPAVLPLDAFKDEITQQAKAATGRNLSIDGEMSVSIVPNVAVTAKGVRFANAPGGSAPDMASLDALRVKVQLLPLLGGEIAVDEFILVKPEILLEIDEQGRPNWQFADGDAAAESSGATSGQASDSGGGGLPDLRLGDVRIVDGKITYIDRAAGTREEVTDLDLELTLPDMNSRFRAAGDFGLRGREIAAELEAASLGQLMGGTATPVKAAVTSDLVTLTFDGEVTQAAAATVGGTIDLDVPSLQELMAFASPEAAMQAREGTFGPFRVDGKLDMVGQKISFQDAEIALDELVARGNMQFDGSGEVPRITASISTDLLDVTPYLGGAEGGDGQGETQSSGGGDAQPSGWSEDPIDLSGLRAANADISISTAGLKVNDLQIGQSALAILLEGGRLSAKLTEMQLYGGNGSGEVVADGSGDTAAVAAKFDLTGVEAEPILIDAAKMDRLSGTLESNFDIRGSGISQKALVSALNGAGAFKFTDGAVKGVNIAAMFRNISLDAIKGSFSEAEKTDFAELTGTFQITNGILRNSDLLMLAPVLRMTGEGEVPLPSRTIDYTIKPKLVGTLEGQGGDASAKGLTIPVRISGSWDDPSYQPDMEAILKEQIGDPGSLVEGVQDAVEGESGSLKDAVKDLGKSEDGESPAKQLKKLFD